MADTTLAVPIHFSEDFSVFSRLQTDSCTGSYRGKIAFLLNEAPASNTIDG